MIENLIVSLYGSQVFVFLTVIYYGALIVLPVVLFREAWNMWLYWRKLKWHQQAGWLLLEVHIPREIKKSPQAMEMVLESFFQTGQETTFIDRNITGKHRAWFSLEIVSNGGELHFFIWTRKAWRSVIEASIYSQYPSIEIFEVKDYTEDIPFDLDKYFFWGCEFDLTKPDPYPIKTYRDFDLDKETKEDGFAVDPLSSTLEFMGGLNEGHRIWIQIIVRAHKKEKRVKGKLFKKQSWREEGKVLVKDLMKKSTATSSGDGSTISFPNLTKWQNQLIESIERNIDKHAFDVGIRGFYIADHEVFDPINISALVGIFKQFSSEEMNGFKPTRGLAIFNYPWQDYKDIRRNNKRKKIFEAYKLRSYFHRPYKSPNFVLSIEELATIYHFPGEVVTTPTIARIKSRKVEAPVDLPR